MKYSFIIPVLNEEKIIRNLLNQISDEELKKKYDYEIILSDGGSHDNTVLLALPFADKIVVHTESYSQTISMGRNKGAAAAEGEYLIFINGDVLFRDLNEFFLILEKRFLGSSYLAFTCRVKIMPAEETLADKLFLGFYNRYFNFLNIIGIGMGRGECHVVRHDVFNSLNGNNPVLAAGEDFDLFRRIKKKGRILYYRKACVYESPRRYRKEGHLRIFISWFLNSFSVFFFGKSVSQTWKEVR